MKIEKKRRKKKEAVFISQFHAIFNIFFCSQILIICDYTIYWPNKSVPEDNYRLNIQTSSFFFCSRRKKRGTSNCVTEVSKWAYGHSYNCYTSFVVVILTLVCSVEFSISFDLRKEKKRKTLTQILLLCYSSWR